MPCTRARPVIRRIAKTVQRRGKAIVELFEGADAARAGGIQVFGKLARLLFDLRDERFDEASQIKPIARRA